MASRTVFSLPTCEEGVVRAGSAIRSSVAPVRGTRVCTDHVRRPSRARQHRRLASRSEGTIVCALKESGTVALAIRVGANLSGLCTASQRSQRAQIVPAAARRNVRALTEAACTAACHAVHLRRRETNCPTDRTVLEFWAPHRSGPTTGPPRTRIIDTIIDTTKVTRGSASVRLGPLMEGPQHTVRCRTSDGQPDACDAHFKSECATTSERCSGSRLPHGCDEQTLEGSPPHLARSTAATPAA